MNRLTFVSVLVVFGSLLLLATSKANPPEYGEPVGDITQQAKDKKKSEGITILRKWIKDNTIDIVLRGPGDKSYSASSISKPISIVTFDDINKYKNEKVHPESERVNLSVIKIGEGLPECAYLTNPGTTGYGGELWQVNKDKSLKLVLTIGGWHAVTSFSDIDHDGVLEIVNKETMDYEQGIYEKLKEYDLDLSQQRIVKTSVYKWKDDKFQTIGRLFKVYRTDPKTGQSVEYDY